MAVIIINAVVIGLCADMLLESTHLLTAAVVSIIAVWGFLSLGSTHRDRVFLLSEVHS